MEKTKPDTKIKQVKYSLEANPNLETNKNVCHTINQQFQV